MRRGPFPDKGFTFAMPFAHLRGRVMHFLASPWYVSDFTIYGNGRLSFVRLRLARRIHATIGEIADDFSTVIKGMLAIPGGGPVCRELWLYSRHGTLRFFLADEAGIVELDCYGTPFVNGRPIIRDTDPVTGTPFAGKISGAMPASVPADLIRPVGKPTAKGLMENGELAPNGPIARWLKKRNAGKKAEAGNVRQAGPDIRVKDAAFVTGESGKK